MAIDYMWDLYRCAVIVETVNHEPKTLNDTLYLSKHDMTNYRRMVKLVYNSYDNLSLWRFVNEGFEEWIKALYKSLEADSVTSTVVIPWGVNGTRITAVIGKPGVTPVAIYPMPCTDIITLLNRHPLQFKDYASKVYFYKHGMIVVDNDFKDWDEVINMTLHPVTIKRRIQP